MGSIVAFIYGTALFGSTYLLPVYMQLGLQLSASHVGTVLLPAGLVLAITILLVGRLADALAVQDLLARLDPTLTIGTANALVWSLMPAAVPSPEP